MEVNNRKAEKTLKKFTQPELDHFFNKVSMNLEKELSDPTAHMIFITNYHQPKKYNQLEQTPMYRMKGSGLVSAQRISYFIANGVDVKKKSHLFMLCGESNCINPKHLIYLPTESERKEFINK